MEKIHPATPAFMVGYLLAGSAFALGHHFFYSSLDHKPIEDLSYNLNYFKEIAPVDSQAINIAVGTAFAFLVKTCLVNAVGIAFTQSIWKIARGKSNRVATLDSVFSMTNNIANLFRVRLWLSQPLMMLLALLTWLLPLAALISPGTLTVSHERHNSSMTNVVPLVDFTRLSFANVPGKITGQSPDYASSTATYTYSGPRDSVDKVVTGTMFGGRISLLTPPAINSSWDLEFPGPALRCDTLSGSDKSAIVDNVWQESTKPEPESSVYRGYSCTRTYAYLSWIPVDGPSGHLPFPDDVKSTGAGRSMEIGDSMTIYVAAFDQMLHSFDHTESPSCKNRSKIGAINPEIPPAHVLEDAVVVKCQLWNRSYHTNFMYENGVQTMGIKLGEYYNNITNIVLVNSDPKNETEKAAPEDYINFDDRRLSFAERQYLHFGEVDTLDKINPLATLAYQSLMDSFKKPLIGQIFNDAFLTNGLTTNATIMSTVLSNQPELAFLQSFDHEIPHQSLEDTDSPSAPSNTPALSQLALAEALEQVFQNITMSLFSDEEFQHMMPVTPGPIEVRTWTDRNIYIYGWRTLWVSYGVALAFSACGVVVGLVVMYVTGAAFSSNFSTYLRTIRTAELSVEVLSSDIDGADPVPKYLATAQVAFLKGSESKDKGVEQTRWTTINVREKE